MGLIGTFIGILGSIWMLAIANKVVGDAWDILFSEQYKEWLIKMKNAHKHIKVKDGIITINIHRQEDEGDDDNE